MVRSTDNLHENVLLDDAQISLLRDMKAFIEHGIRNNVSFPVIVSTLGHDINGIGGRYGFDLDAASKDGFTPKVSRYSWVTEDDVGQAEEVGE